MKEKTKKTGYKNVYLSTSSSTSINSNNRYFGRKRINKKDYITSYYNDAKLAAKALDLLMIKNDLPTINNFYNKKS